jgi:hypothetical protein
MLGFESLLDVQHHKSNLWPSTLSQSASSSPPPTSQSAKEENFPPPHFSLFSLFTKAVRVLSAERQEETVSVFFLSECLDPIMIYNNFIDGACRIH